MTIQKFHSFTLLFISTSYNEGEQEYLNDNLPEVVSSIRTENEQKKGILLFITEILSNHFASNDFQTFLFLRVLFYQQLRFSANLKNKIKKTKFVREFKGVNKLFSLNICKYVAWKPGHKKKWRYTNCLEQFSSKLSEFENNFHYTLMSLNVKYSTFNVFFVK